MNETGSFRKKQGFTMAGNTLVRDIKVYHKVKGLYLLIMSYITMENLNLTKSFLKSKSAEGEKAFCSTWDELKQKGYLKVYIYPSKKGKKGWQVEYDLLDEPQSGPHTFYLAADGTVSNTNLTKIGVEKQSAREKKRYPQNGSNADGIYVKGGNNIILSNNTLSNTINNNPSIHQSVHSVCVESDRLTEEELKDIVCDEIASNNGIPYYYKSDERKMRASIRSLTNWYGLTDKDFHNEFEKVVFDLLVDCLSEMACADEIKTYKGSRVSYVKVIDKINECVKADLDLSHFAEETVDDYIQAASDCKIKDKQKYMKSVIWNGLCTYRVKFESFLVREGFKNLE